jgi:hypothetical protein
MRGGQALHCAFLLVLVMFDIPRKIFKRLSTNLQKHGIRAPLIKNKTREK